MNRRESFQNETKKRLLAFLLVSALLLCSPINIIAEDSPIGRAAGNVTVESTGTQYASLADALAAANATDTLSVSGDVNLPADLTLDKNITLQAAASGGKLFTESTTNAPVITVNGGNTLTMGSGSSANELLMEGIHVKVTAGKLHMKDGAHFISNLEPVSIIEINGANSSASFDGGLVENPNDTTGKFNNSYLVSILDGATVDRISGGTFNGAHITFNVRGEGSTVQSITGGKFSSSAVSRLSEPGFKLSRKAHIDTISGGEFISHRFGALQLESGSSINEISGGSFKNPLDTVDTVAGFAKPYFSGLVIYGRTTGSPQVYEPVTVNKITGGSFEGRNGMIAVGSRSDMKAQIGQITGGKFVGIQDSGLYFSQNSEVDLLSGNISVTGDRNGIWSAGKIGKIDGGTYVGDWYSGLSNNDLTAGGSAYSGFKGEIGEISGGTFIGDSDGMKNTGKVDTISNGIFKGDKYAVNCSDSQGFGILNTIKNGVFYAKNDGPCCITLVTPLSLEPGLSASQPEFGAGRYIVSGTKPIFNDDSLVTFPEYQDPEDESASIEYFMSHPDDTKSDVAAYPGVGFRFLRQKVKFKYNYNLGDDPDVKIGNYLMPGDNVSVWSDTSAFGGDPVDYTFNGWNTEADGSGEDYAGGDTVTGVVKDTMLYAQWQAVTIDVDGSKTWDDNSDQDGVRPASITINLLKDGNKIDSKVVTAADSWAWSFKNLPKYNAGSLIDYTITEDPVANYSATVSGYDVTNTHTPAKTSVKVTKTWDDGNDQDGVRPTSATIKLFADGVDTGKTLTLTPGNSWTDTFTDLDEYQSGAKIDYTIQEVAVGNGYTIAISGDAESGYVVTNSRTPETISVAGSKTWDDNSDQDGKRPASITINLLQDGTKIDSKVVTATDSWSWNFVNLPKYNAGSLITYTITEDAVAEYSATISGYDVTNTHTPGKTSVQVTKAWDDGNDQDGVRPTSATIKLFADGVDTGKTLTLTPGNSWTDTFTGLDEYQSGAKIDYTIQEVAVGNGYTTTISGDAQTGYLVTNSRTPETISVAGSKTWDDKNDQDGKRPASITINLLQDGTKIDSKVVTAADSWSWNFVNLPKYNAGSLITYTITEDAVPEYSAKANGYNMKNAYTPGKTSVQVTISWDDGNDRDGIRPNHVKVKLFADGEDTGKTLTLKSSSNWTDTFTALDEYKAGKKIDYSIEATPVEQYSSSISGDTTEGFILTYRHKLKNATTDDSGSDSKQPIKPSGAEGTTIGNIDQPKAETVNRALNKANQPKTGDEGLTGLWLGLMLMSIVGFVFIGRRSFKIAADDYSKGQ